MASRSSLEAFFQRSWIGRGTLHFTEGFTSHKRLNLFIRAPSVVGAGLSADGSTETLETVGGFPTFVAEGAGVVLGDGAATLGGGVANSDFDNPLPFFMAAISACIFLFASTTIKTYSLQSIHTIH